MELAVADNPEAGRYEITADGRPAGFAKYHLRPGLIAFVHTEIDDEFEGEGLGSELAQFALDDARSRDLAVLPFCPFISGWIKRHEEYVDLVPEDHRERFDL